MLREFGKEKNDWVLPIELQPSPEAETATKGRGDFV
jgi:hypothetical protein